MSTRTRRAPAVALAALIALAACTGQLGLDNDGGGNPLDPDAPPSPDMRPTRIDVPRAHPRLWFDADRLARAKAYFASHPFQPRAVTDANTALDAALHSLLTGDASSCRAAIEWATSVTFRTDGVSSDGARWFGEAVILTFDWCFDAMSADDRALLVERWNGYIQTLNDRPWGGIGMEGNNYYTGYFRNTLLWAIATFHENPKANGFLTYAIDTRWKTSLLPYINAAGRGGAPGEGSTYGRRTFGYLTVPFTTLGLLDHDMWSFSPYFVETVFWTLYSTTPGPSRVMGNEQRLYETFPYNEDERWTSRDPIENTAMTSLGSYLAPLIEEWSDQPVAGYARRFLDMTGTRVDNRYIEYVTADAVAAVEPRDLAQLPLDYYAAGLGMLYAKTSWAADATFVNQQFSPAVGVGHQHRDAGSFQLWRDGEFLTRESVGYADFIVGYGDTQVDCESPTAHNTLLFNGRGIVSHYEQLPEVLRLASTDDATYAAVDLTGVYDVSAAWKAREAEVGNPAAGRAVRETLFVRKLETLVVFDRVESGNSDPAVTKTFLVHFEGIPTVDGNVLSRVQGDQRLTVTTLVPAGAGARLVDETAGGALRVGQIRAEIETSGQVVSHFLHVLAASDAADAEVATELVEDEASYTLTLSHPGKGSAVVTFAKGIVSTGGSFGYAASGTPTAAPLRADVQGMSVTAEGPAWAP
jgi:hypothetical protein